MLGRLSSEENLHRNKYRSALPACDQPVAYAFTEEDTLRSRIALVRIEGPILDSRDIVEEIKEHITDHSIKAIILRIDSPGGAVAPLRKSTRSEKSCCCKKSCCIHGLHRSVRRVLYRCPADMIIANPGTLTGSIGVIMEIPNIEV